jgi:signal transduction histidine kinase
MNINFYRIISELMNNSYIHANPQKVYVEIKENEAFIHLRYMDDGKGFDYDLTKGDVKNKGMGLNNIFSRVKSLNGYYSIVTAPDNGFLIEFFFPKNND